MLVLDAVDMRNWFIHCNGLKKLHQETESGFAPVSNTYFHNTVAGLVRNQSP